MKKLLMSISALVVLLSGCATPSLKWEVGGNYSEAELKKACDLNDGRACTILGVIYKHGQGVKKLYPMATQGVKKDYLKAKKYFSKACELNDRHGCYNLGMTYMNGQGVKKDYLKAKRYFQKACSLNESFGCRYYKELESKGY